MSKYKKNIFGLLSSIILIERPKGLPVWNANEEFPPTNRKFIWEQIQLSIGKPRHLEWHLHTFSPISQSKSTDVRMGQASMTLLTVHRRERPVVFAQESGSLWPGLFQLQART